MSIGSSPSSGKAGPPPIEPPPTQVPVKLYADFERTNGGLLWVLQGLMVACQALTLPYLRMGQWWSPAYLLPAYVLYFAVRHPLWVALYRRAGHVESERALREARSGVWGGLAIVVVGVAGVWAVGVHPMSAPWWVGIAWVLGFFLVLVALGKLQVDVPLLILDWLLAVELLKATPRTAAALSLLRNQQFIPIAVLVILGLTQHFMFVRAMRPRGGA